MEQLAQRYPETHAQLMLLPDHVADHVGSVVVGLTHEDMHPKIETESEFGHKKEAIDFDHLITDPEYDSDQLEVDAIEAAQKGQQALSDILIEGAKTINKAQQKLMERGVSFGAGEPETDEQRNQREVAERDIVYKEACEQAVNKASKAKQAGDSEASKAALESLILLKYVHGGESRKVFRDAVRAGLADELISAASSARKICRGSDYERVTRSIQGSVDMLEFVTGQGIDNEFNLEGETTFYGKLGSFEDTKDIVAAMAAPDTWLIPQHAFQTFHSNGGIANSLRPNFDPQASAGERGSAAYFDEVVERCLDFRELECIFKFSDPKDALDARDLLGIEMWRVQASLAKSESTVGELSIDMEAVRGLLEIKDTHPLQFDDLLTMLQGKLTDTKILDGFKSPEFLSSLDSVISAGFGQKEVLELLMFSGNQQENIKAAMLLVEACQKAGIGGDSFIKSMPKSRRNGSSELGLYGVFEIARANPEKLDRLISDVQLQSQIYDLYMDTLNSFEYPITEAAPNVFRPEALTLLQTRLDSIGLPAEVAQEMIESWSTYKSFSDTYYNNESGRFEYPKEPMDEKTLHTIASKQVEAFRHQLFSLEDVVDKHGIETAKGIIKEFGIYNFARHTTEALVDQYERWTSGEEVKTIVVESRSDWNSFAGQHPEFKGESGQGVFYFEASSGRETARIAVRVGQRERKLGREPDVDRFIINAHGSPDGLNMGPKKNDRIDLKLYREAAQNATIISAREINDYRKHLGPHFTIILQSCSTGSRRTDAVTIASIMKGRHDAETNSYDYSIRGLIIDENGYVKFKTNEGDGLPVELQEAPELIKAA